MKYSSTPLGFTLALLLASFGSLSACYDPPKVQSGDGAGGTGGANSSATSSGQGGSGGELCASGSVKMCAPYSGPLQTEGVGACKPSVSTCTESGTWSVCIPEVIPTIESCKSNFDVNCDGLMSCTGIPIRVSPVSGSIQTPKDEAIYALAIGPDNKGADGNVYAVGARNAILSGVPNEQRVLFWNQKPDGSIQDWSNLFTFTPNTPTSGAHATGVGVIPASGDIVISGAYHGGALEIAGVPFQSSTNISSFLTRISPTGMLNTAQVVNMGGSLEVRDLAIDTLGNVYLGGTYAGSPVVQGFQLPTASNDDGFLLRMNPDGQPAWAQTFTGTGSQTVTSIVAMNPDDLIISVAFTGPMMISTPQGSIAYDAGTTVDGLLIRMDGFGGVTHWATQLPSGPSPSQITVRDIAVRDTVIAVGGRFRGTATFGSVDYIAADGDTGDAFIAILNVESGNLMNHFASQAIGEQEVSAVAFDSAGDLLIAGSFSGSIPIPQIPTMSSSDATAYVAKLNGALTGLWGQHFGAGSIQGSQRAQSVIVGNGSGHIYMGGAFQGSLPNVNGNASSIGGFDAFVLQLGD